MSPSLEIAVRLGCFAAVFASMALWEWFAPRRHLTAGRRPRWFRPPFVEVDARIAGEAAAVGLGTINFDVASGDPAPGMMRERLVHTVLANVRPGSIVVLHANHRRFATADALPEIIAGLRAKGFELVTVSRLVDAGSAVR